jgi:hypothetical protein
MLLLVKSNSTNGGVRVIVAYEAGQNGCWILGALRSGGIGRYIADATEAFRSNAQSAC